VSPARDARHPRDTRLRGGATDRIAGDPKTRGAEGTAIALAFGVRRQRRLRFGAWTLSVAVHAALLGLLLLLRAAAPDRAALFALAPETEVESILDLVAPDETPAAPEEAPEPAIAEPEAPETPSEPPPPPEDPAPPEEFELLPAPTLDAPFAPAAAPVRNRKLPRALRDPRNPPAAAPPAPRPEVPPLAFASRGAEGPSRSAEMSAGKCRPPRYPAIARDRGWEGRVVIRCAVDATGEVTEARVEESSGREVLDEAALAAVRRWRFEPALEEGTPVASEVSIPIRFALEP
jgi:protein TonB